MAQPLKEHAVSVIVIKVESDLTHDSLEIHQFDGLGLVVVLEPVLELLLELIWSIGGGHELDFRVDPLHDDVYALGIELLRAAELKIGEAFLEAFADVNIFELFFYQIACILDQIERDLQITRVDQLVEDGHGLLEHVKFLNFLPGSRGNYFAALESVDFEHLAHLLFFKILNALFRQPSLLLNFGQVLFNLVEVIEGYRKLVKVLSQLLPQVFLDNRQLFRQVLILELGLLGVLNCEKATRQAIMLSEVLISYELHARRPTLTQMRARSLQVVCQLSHDTVPS